MVAPLIARAATRGAGKATRQSLSTDRARRTRRSTYAPQNEVGDIPVYSNGTNPRLLAEARSLNKAVGGNTKDARRIRVVSASTLISWGVLPFYVPQFFFWIVGIVGVGVETSGFPFVDFVLPGTELYIVSYFMIAIIGLFSMAYAVWIYTLRRIKPFQGARMLAFAFGITGYFLFFLNLFPWVIFYILVVIYTEKAKGDA